MNFCRDPAAFPVTAGFFLFSTPPPAENPLLRRRWWNGATARTAGRSDRGGGVHDAAPFSCFAFGAPKSSPTRAQIGWEVSVPHLRPARPHNGPQAATRRATGVRRGVAANFPFPPLGLLQNRDFPGRNGIVCLCQKSVHFRSVTAVTGVTANPAQAPYQFFPSLPSLPSHGRQRILSVRVVRVRSLTTRISCRRRIKRSWRNLTAQSSGCTNAMSVR